MENSVSKNSSREPKAIRLLSDSYNVQSHLPSGEEGSVAWSKDEKFVKLKEFADGRLAELNEEVGGDDEYYDEE